MQSKTKLALTAVGALVAVSLMAGSGQAEQCIKAGGWGTGALEGFASFMAEAAMKNSAKARANSAS